MLARNENSPAVVGVVFLVENVTRSGQKTWAFPVSVVIVDFLLPIGRKQVVNIAWTTRKPFKMALLSSVCTRDLCTLRKPLG